MTEDSFSDGGVYLEPFKAITHALALHAAGANFIDVGAVASNPKAKLLTPQLEIERLSKVLPELKAQKIKISVDSFQTETQRYALKEKADLLNDIHGFSDPSFYPELAASQCSLILMHCTQPSGIAKNTSNPTKNILPQIEDFFFERVQTLEQNGISRSRIILDPGMGFFLGAEPRHSIEVLQNIRSLKNTFSLPILISVSKKSFLRVLSKRETNNVTSATLAAELFAALQGVDYIRTHDVQALNDALFIFETLMPIK